MAVILMAACSPKAAPTKVAAASAPPVSTPVMVTDKPVPAPPVDNTARRNPETIAGGKIIFETKCGQCHGLPKAEGYNVEGWTTIMERMAIKARLDEKEKQQVLAYVHYYAQNAAGTRKGM